MTIEQYPTVTSDGRKILYLGYLAGFTELRPFSFLQVFCYLHPKDPTCDGNEIDVTTMAIEPLDASLQG